MVAFVVALSGVFLTWAAGSLLLDLDLLTIIKGIAISNIAGMTALSTTLWLQLQAWGRKTLVRGHGGTWAYFLTVYFGLLIGGFEPLRNPTILGALILPLIMTTGFTIVTFGPIQDRIVTRRQRRERLAAQSRA